MGVDRFDCDPTRGRRLLVRRSLREELNDLPFTRRGGGDLPTVGRADSQAAATPV